MAITGSQPSYMYALGGYARGGATRGGDTDPQTYITIGGVQVGAVPAVAAQHVMDGTLAIVETEGETPNTASFQVMGVQPTDGQEVIMTQGSKHNLDRLFAGTILTDIHGYIGTPANYNEGIHVIDYTWQLMRDTFSQRWLTTSATVIAQAVIAKAAGRGITSSFVAAGLPVLDEFTVTNQTPAQALSALAARIGGYWKTLYASRVAGARADVRFGLTTDTGQTDPTTVTLASAALTRMENFSVTRDLSQAITRQPVEGGGGNALTDIPPGETILPVTLTDWYNPLGGTVVSGPQRLAYTGVQVRSGGSLVGPGAAPSVAPTLAGAAGSGLSDGVYQYAEVWVTAAGKTLPSPIASITLGGLATAPTIIGTAAEDPLQGFSSMTPGGIYSWVYTFKRNADGLETAPSPAATVTLTSPNPRAVCIDLSGCQAAPTGYTRTWYRTDAGGATYKVRNVTGAYIFQEAATFNGRTNVFVDSAPDSSFGATMVGLAHQVAIGAGLGPTGTTSREIYRTVANGSQLKLQQTIANNTATVGVQDATADGSLGANAPTVDTSGLTTVTGLVLAGATSILTPSAGPFASTGGWAISGQQLIRYTGITGNTLTGIPTAGSGAILSTLNYGDHLDPAPALTGIPPTGVGSILYPIKQGDPVNLRVVVDDVAAQAVIAALMLPTVDDGIIEGAVLQDGTISETEARARGTAQLALRSAIDVAVTCDTRDKNAHASRTLGINLPSPTSVVGSFKLQSVTLDTFTPAQWPIAHLHGASKRFTFEDFLRLARGA